MRLLAVRNSARKDKKQQFNNLFNHINGELLKQSFLELKRNSAPGCDGITWTDYAVKLDENIEELCNRLQSGRYRPKPARRIFIPKEDGAQRALSVICVEDKLVQQATVTVLNQIYETDFMGFSYGFRPGRSQHDGLDALHIAIMKRKVNWVRVPEVPGCSGMPRITNKTAKSLRVTSSPPKDKIDTLWAPCATAMCGKAIKRETGNIQLSGFYSLFGANESWKDHSHAENDAQKENLTVKGRKARAQKTTSR